MLKAKTLAVTIRGTTRLVMARTKAGAIRDVVEELANEAREEATVELATGEQIYEAGMKGDGILGCDRFKHAVDPAQNDLPLPPPQG